MATITFTPAGPYVDAQVVLGSNGRTYKWSTAAGALLAQRDAAASTSTVVTNESGLTGANLTQVLDSLMLTVGGLIFTISPAGSTANVARLNAASTFSRADAGGNAPITYSVRGSPALPAGLVLDPATGQITGTPTVAAAPTVVTIRRKDARGYAVDIPFNIEVRAVAGMAAVVSTTPYANVGEVYNLNAGVSGGSAPITYTIASGSLPAGISLNASTGVIGGTTSATGMFSFVVRATDSLGTTLDTARTISSQNILSRNTTAGVLTPGRVGVAYSKLFSTSGGRAPLVYSLSAGFPPLGLAFSSTTGGLSGTPTTAGPTTFTVRTVDADGRELLSAYSLDIAVANTLVATNPNAPPVSDGGTPYGFSAAVTGGTNPVTYAVTAGTLPAGLVLSASTGAVSGASNAIGSFPVSITATDADGVTLTTARTFSVRARLVPLTTSGTALTTARLTIAYSKDLKFAGGLAPVTYAVTVGSIPPGLVLNASTGVLSGTATALGPYGFTITATDSEGRSVTGDYTMTVVNPAAAMTLRTPATPPQPFTLNVTISADYGVNGGITPIVYSVVGGLPAGLSLNASTGVLSGTPTGPISSTAIDFVATDADGSTLVTNRQIAVSDPLTISAAVVASGKVGVPYAQYINALGGSGGTKVWSVSAGALPPGVVKVDPPTAVDPVTLSGTPTTAGVYLFTIRVVDVAGRVAEVPYVMAIGSATSTQTAINPVAAPGDAFSYYSMNAGTTGGTNPKTYKLVSSTPFAGVTLNTSTGSYSGQLWDTGVYAYTIASTDAAGDVLVTSRVATVAERVRPLVLPEVLNSFRVGVPASRSLAFTGGEAPFTYLMEFDTPPAGMTFNTTTGVLSGTPTTSSEKAFRITATASAGRTANKIYAFAVSAAAPSLSFNVPVEPNSVFTVGVPVSLDTRASGGVAPLTHSMFGALEPATGLTYNSATGMITGTPTVGQASRRSFSTAGANGEVLTTLRAMNVSSPISVSTSITPGQVGIQYTGYTFASGGGISYLTFTVISGAIPPGLTMYVAGDTNVVYLGKPTAAGTYNFTLRVSDQDGRTKDQALTFTINP